MLATSGKTSRPYVLLPILLSAILPACSKDEGKGKGAGAASTLPDVPAPSLSDLESVVRQQIEEAQAAVKASPRDATVNGRLAMLYHLYGLTDAAAAAYQRTALIEPRTHKWHYLRASCLAGSDRKQDVIESLQAAVDAKPDFLLGWIGLGYRHLEAKDYDAARRAFQKAGELDTDSAQAAFGLGQTELQSGRHNEAVDALRRAATRAPQAGIVHRTLAEAYEKVGNAAAAANAQMAGYRPGGLPPMPTPELDEVEALATGSSSELKLARQAAAQGDFDGAMSHVDRALEYAPQSADAHLTKATLLMNAQKNDEALELLKQAVEASPNEPLLLIGLGDMLLRSGQIDEARQRFEQAVAAAPDRVEARLAMARFQESQGNLTAAVDLLRAILTTQSEQIETRYYLGRLLAAQRKLDEAQVEMERLVQQRPDHAPAHHVLAELLAAKGRKEEAIFHAQAAIQAQSQDPHTHVLLAQLYWGDGQYGMVDRTLNDGLRRHPRSLQLANSLAWLRATCPEQLYRNGAEAVRLASSVIEAVPEDPQLLDTLAAAQAESGDFAAAVKTQQKVVELIRTAGRNPSEGGYEARLSLYQSGQKYRETMGGAPTK
ncbi:MAG: tetratricopeptide repeat protein [Phycisphaerae bacterium]|nr:tetratricopeptide repeat protein [Phycisphaerae bacterium]